MNIGLIFVLIAYAVANKAKISVIVSQVNKMEYLGVPRKSLSRPQRKKLAKPKDTFILYAKCTNFFKSKGLKDFTLNIVPYKK